MSKYYERSLVRGSPFAKICLYLGCLDCPNLLRSWPTRNLSIQQLTLKKVMLVALVSADRGQILSLLDCVNICKTKSKIIVHRIKTTRPSKSSKTVIIPSLDLDPSLCPRRALSRYLEITQPYRNCPSYKKPFHSVGAATVG